MLHFPNAIAKRSCPSACSSGRSARRITGALAARTKEVSFETGDTVFRQADPGRSMMVIAEGTVRVSLPGRGGRDIVLADLKRGAVLGEISLLDGRPRSATATAVTPCTLLVLERPAIGPILRSNPSACLAIVDLLCDRLRRSDERMIEISLTQQPDQIAEAAPAIAAG